MESQHNHFEAEAKHSIEYHPEATISTTEGSRSVTCTHLQLGGLIRYLTYIIFGWNGSELLKFDTTYSRSKLPVCERNFRESIH